MVRNFLTAGQPGYRPELDPKNAAFDIEKYKIEVLNRIGARFENRFNEFQSVSQGNEDNPQTKAGTALKGKVDAALVPFVIDAMQKPNTDQVLNRAGAVTCGGCHKFVRRQGGRAGKRPEDCVAEQRRICAGKGDRPTFRSTQ